jgi:hypothetical protein
VGTCLYFSGHSPSSLCNSQLLHHFDPLGVPDTVASSAPFPMFPVLKLLDTLLLVLRWSPPSPMKLPSGSQTLMVELWPLSLMYSLGCGGVGIVAVQWWRRPVEQRWWRRVRHWRWIVETLSPIVPFTFWASRPLPSSSSTSPRHGFERLHKALVLSLSPDPLRKIELTRLLHPHILLSNRIAIFSG